jgi:3-oxoacyl-[acyl-carrier protein] reductase
MFHTAFTQEQFGARALAAGTSYADEVARFAENYRIAARRFGDTQDVGALVAWLCSQFAGYITGQSIVIDGGATRSTF